MDPYIEVKLSNIIDNYKTLKSTYNKNIIAVIKDNAYGHGLIKIGQELAKNNVFMLCVSTLNEAISLRKNMIFTPILLLGRCDDAKLLFSFKITPSVSSLDQLKKLKKENIPLPFHLEIETGMNRLGIPVYALTETKKIIENSRLKLKGIFTHFCSTEYNQQEKLFKQALNYFEIKNLVIHCQASNYLNLNLDYANTLRIGLALYGYSTLLPLKPCMKFYIPIWRISKIGPHQKIGYDGIELTKENGYIVTLPIGYATAFSRLKLHLIYDNIELDQIGKSCMDMTMFFAKNEIKEDALINILDKKNIESLLTKNNESIYYLLSSISPSIKRIYY